MPRTATRDGYRIHYEVEPGAHPVLLIHGFASSAELNWVQSGWVRTLADSGLGSIRVDLPAHGNSDAPTDPDLYTLPRLADAVLSAVDDTGITECDVMGYSMGAQVARVLAARHPERVRRLVLGGIGDREQFATWGAAELAAAVGGGPQPSDELAAALVAAVHGNPSLDAQAVAACIRGVASAPIGGAPTAPTLVVAGDQDPVAADAPALAERLGARFVAVPGRNHRNSVTARAFKEAVLAFLGAGPPSDTTAT